MAEQKMWFGNQNRFQWVPAPSSGIEVSNVGFTQSLNYQDGRVGVTRSAQSHKEFGLEFEVREASGADGLDIFQKYASGFYGSQDKYPLFFADPMNYDQNLFPPGWASPGLYGAGWRSINYDGGKVYINVARNPSVELDATGYTTTAGTGGTASGARTSSGPQVSGLWSYRATWSVATSAVSGGVNYTGTPVVAGAVYEFSTYVTCSKIQRVQMTVRFRNSGGTSIGTATGTQTVLAANTPTRLVTPSVTVPATTTTVDIEVAAVSGTSGSNWASGNWLQMDATMIAFDGNLPTTYFDGTFPGASWSGLAHGSSSYLYVTQDAPVISTTPSNAYDLPPQQATFNIVLPPDSYPKVTDRVPYALIPIPPGYTLWMGATGSATGTARVAVRLFNSPADDASPVSTTALTLLSSTGATRMNASFPSTSGQFVKVYLDRTSSAVSSLTISSMMAQLWPTGVTPVTSGRFIEGKGHRGLKFGDDALAETYHMVDRNRNIPVRYKGLSTRLIEAQDRG